LFPLPRSPQKPGSRSTRTLSLVPFNTADKGRETYLSFTRLNAKKPLPACRAGNTEER
jgi:hypothetical protein